ncbi:aromatic prenyltransferase [Streptomyces sp. NPDC058646]|uniref:aromatic prenyltransferase n=1 Tax=Streptomyces sp. NPDC058646 TaxID=3346574 RepID=UPI0036674DB0
MVAAGIATWGLYGIPVETTHTLTIGGQVSGVTEVEKLYSALQESARLVGAPYSRDKVQPILTAFGDALADGVVVFSVQTGGRHSGELDYSFMAPPGLGDPYPHAVAHGFITESDHPVHSVLSDIQGRWGIREHFVDCGVVGGFKKLYAHFPDDLQKVSALAAVPSVPRAVAENADLFARYGLDEVAMIGVDYKRRTMNLYFQFSPDGRPGAEAIGSMLREIGLHEPDQRMLEFAQKSMRANITFSWDSPRIVRVAFAPPPGLGLDPAAVPAPIEPHIERFVTTAPRAYEGERMTLFGVKWFPDGEFIDVCTYYRLSSWYEPYRSAATDKEQV